MNAVVTGAGAGVGLAVAQALRRAGADVLAAVHRDPRDGAVACDVRDPASVDALFAAARMRFGGQLDVLVNAAGALVYGPALDLDPAEFKRVADTVVKGTFLCARAALELFEGHGGVIVNVTSPMAWTGGPGFVAESAARAGVLSLTLSLAAEWAPLGVRVNAVATGPVDTPAVRATGRASELARTTLTGELGAPDAVAAAVVYLCSEAARAVTGEVLVVDGGQWLRQPRGVLA